MLNRTIIFTSPILGLWSVSTVAAGDALARTGRIYCLPKLQLSSGGGGLVLKGKFATNAEEPGWLIISTIEC